MREISLVLILRRARLRRLSQCRLSGTVTQSLLRDGTDSLLRVDTLQEEAVATIGFQNAPLELPAALD